MSSNNNPYNIPDVGPSYVVLSGLASAVGLPSLVELVYVRVGNEVMAQALSKLELALASTQTALTALTQLQGYHNQIAVGSKSAISFKFSDSSQTLSYTVTSLTDVAVIPTTTNIGGGPIPTILTTGSHTILTSFFTVSDSASYVSGYQLVASSYYTQINPYFAVTVPGALTATPITALNSGQLTPAMLSAVNYFRGELAATKTSISAVIAQLTPITSSTDPTTLLAQLKTVYGELPTSSYSSLRSWALDGYTAQGGSAVVSQGLIQQNITNAITAGESLNNSQTAAVRNYMFVFEQYYQSAAAVINSLNQIMSDIARKISG